MKNIAVFGYLQKNNEILLVKHNYGNKAWHLPGGSVEKGESLENALKREYKEETGLTITTQNLQSIIYSRKNYAISYVYRVQVNKTNIRQYKNKEIEEVNFFPIDELPLEISKNAKYRIETCHKKGILIEEWDP